MLIVVMETSKTAVALQQGLVDSTTLFSTSSVHASDVFNMSNFSNGSHGNASVSAMPDVLALRFLPYTILAAICFVLNLFSLLAMLETKRFQRKVRHVLLINLAVCDLVGSVLLWMYQNAYQIFPRFTADRPIHCLFIFSVLVAPFVLSLCISAFSLLLLALNQLAAICRPLFATSRLAPRHAVIATAVAWSVAAGAALCPGVVLVVFWPIEQCALYRHKIGKLSIEVCAYSLLALILIIVIVYANIYRVVIKHRHYEPEVGRRNVPQEQTSNYKAFITILLLTGSLSLFWLPYMLFHFVSAHFLNTDNEQDISDALIYLKCYLIDFLPMLNFLADPLIYGFRMPEVRRGYRQLARVLCCGQCNKNYPSAAASSKYYSEATVMQRYTSRLRAGRDTASVAGTTIRGENKEGGGSSYIRGVRSVYSCTNDSVTSGSQALLMKTYVGSGSDVDGRVTSRDLDLYSSGE